MFERLRRLFGKKTKQGHATHATTPKARHAVRKPRRPGRDTSAAFQGTRREMFFAGEDVKIYTSDWVESAQWAEDASLLKITFDDGHVHFYPCDADDALAFADAHSKGGFIHDYYLSRGITGSA